MGVASLGANSRPLGDFTLTSLYVYVTSDSLMPRTRVTDGETRWMEQPRGL